MTPTDIAKACGIPGYVDNVTAVWNMLIPVLDKYGINDHLTRIAAAATIAVETGVFYPIEEEGGESYWRQELGNQWYYHGRGLVQCTWLYNYQHYGSLLGIDLVNHPEKALDMLISCEIFALYFKENNIPYFADNANWLLVREKVNGGTNGWPTYISCVNNLLAINDTPIKYTITLIPKASLKLAANHTCRAVADLAAGCIVEFTGHTKGNWAEVKVLTGTTQKLKPVQDLHLQGWLLRGDLQETHS